MIKVNPSAYLLPLSILLLGSYFTLLSQAYGNEWIEFELSAQNRVISVPFPRQKLMLNSKVSVLVDYKNIPVKVSYALLWPSVQEEETSIRVLNLSFEQPISTKAVLFWQSTDQSINKSSEVTKNKSKLVFTDLNQLRETLLLTPTKDIDDTWYRHNQRLTAAYLGNEKLLEKNKYPKTAASQWLYDRAQAFYQLYLGTGEEQWKLDADNFVLFYKNQINSEGFFKLSKPKDVKYLMGRSLVYDYVLNQNHSSLQVLSSLYEASLSWRAEYSISQGFWTERHHASALNVAISYWELTGDVAVEARIKQLISTIYNMTFRPSNGWELRNCPQHTFKSHEGWGDKSPACSPWMMALLADNLWRYYWLTGDKKSAELLSAFANFVATEGIYIANEGKITGQTIPKYLVSLDNSKQEELDPWSDRAHTCDVAAMVGKGVYIKHVNKQPSPSTLNTFSQLAQLCKNQHLAVVEKYKYVKLTHMKSKPPRKFNWQYSTTDDLPWLMKVLNQSKIK